MSTAARPVVAPASDVALVGAGGRAQARARLPDVEGYAERDGVRLYYEVHGAGAPTALLLPTWSIIHSRFWKFQIPYLARHCRVLTFDGRGNGRSDRPVGAVSYSSDEFARDALAVMDHGDRSGDPGRPLLRRAVGDDPRR